MNELFTVKLDLSAIAHNEPEEHFILLVDPRKMKMIYEFKLWVRFLFSIECLIQLVYDGAVIHDLDDIHILSVLKAVQVLPADRENEEFQEEEKILAKLNKYNEWCETTRHIMFTEQQDLNSSAMGVNVQTSRLPNGVLNSSKLSNENGVIDKMVTSLSCMRNRTNESQCNSSVEACTKPNYSIDRTNVIPYSHTFQKDKVSVVNSPTGNTQPNQKINSTYYTFPEQSGFEIPQTVEQWRKKISKIKTEDTCNDADTVTKDQAQKKKEAHDKKINNSIPPSLKKNFHKPFSVGDVMEFLRSANNDVESTNNKSHCLLPPSESTPVKQDCSDGPNDLEEDDNSFKKNRKRIRKHKSKKKNSESDLASESFASTTSHQSLNDEDRLKLSPDGVKPKHIRFDSDENTMVYDSAQSGTCVKVQDCENHISASPGQSNDLDEIIRGMLDEKRKQLCASAFNGSAVNGANDAPALECEKSLDKTPSIESDKEKVDNPPSILEMFCNFRKKNAVPMVVDRFS